MNFRSTEISVREVLLTELRVRGVRIGHELSAALPSGRMAPDAVLCNGADYVLETKLGGQADYFEDLKKLTEWMKIRSVPIRGGFAVLLPGQLREVAWQEIREAASSMNLRFEVSALFRDERPADRCIGNLAQVSDWMAEHVLRPNEVREPDTDFVIKVLAGAVAQLSQKLRELDVRHFEEIFGGRPVFDNILEIRPGRMPAQEMRRAASYLLINQLIFYHVLSRANPEKFAPIDTDSLQNPTELTRYFEKVLEVDYAPTFGFDVASKLPKTSIDTLKSVTEVIQAMGLAGLRQDVLGKVFHNLIPLSVRKPVAAYYTNKQAGDLLATLAIGKPDDTILDPACGSGTLLVASYQRKRRLSLAYRNAFNEDDHRRLLAEEITGVDIMPFAAHLAVVNLSLQSPRFITQRIRIAVEDSTKLKPNTNIPSLTRELSLAFSRPSLDMFDDGNHPKLGAKYVERGVLTIAGFQGEGIHLSSVDTVIMNPPFTSSDRLGAEYKQILKKRFGAKYEDCLKGKLGLHGYFLLLADRFLKPGGRVAAVIPQTTLTGETFAPIVNILRTRYSILAIVVGVGRSAYSENTMLSEILLVAAKKTPMRNHHFALMATKKSPVSWTDDDVKTLSAMVESNGDIENHLATVRRVPQTELVVEEGGLTKLLPYLNSRYGGLRTRMDEIFRHTDLVSYEHLEKKLGIKALISPLGNKEAEGPDGRGGVYYGASGLNICMDERRALKRVDRLILIEDKPRAYVVRDRVTEQQFHVPKSAVVPNVRRISHHTRMDISTDTDLVISESYKGLGEILSTIYGEKQAKVFLARIRDRWRKRIDQGMSHVFLERRVDMSARGTHHISVYTSNPSFTGRGPWSIRNIENDDAKLLCYWFNSSLFLYQLLEHRTQTRGTWWELSKHRFSRTQVPDITCLGSREKSVLHRSFSELKDTAFPDLLEQFKTSYEGRKRIDASWLSVLGVPSSEIDGIVNALHEYIYETLSSLKSSMGKSDRN